MGSQKVKKLQCSRFMARFSGLGLLAVLAVVLVNEACDLPPEEYHIGCPKGAPSVNTLILQLRWDFSAISRRALKFLESETNAQKNFSKIQITTATMTTTTTNMKMTTVAAGVL